jgi:hypothetical protein
MTKTRWAVLAITGAMTVTSVVVGSAVSCAATPVIPPLRSFESAKDIDVVCMQILTANVEAGVVGLPISPPIPVDQQFCTPVALNQYGAVQPYHLYALVTQVARGEVAVVDLTAGMIIDEDPATPGVNFLPVGAQPAGIAAAPNGQMTFVTSADPNKPAIYGLTSTKILGSAVNYDSGIVTAYNGAQAQVPTLVTWPACSLPEVPGPIIAVPRPPLVVGQGPGDGPESQGYVLAVVLPGNGQDQTARVLTIDPRPLLRGGGIDVGPGPVVPPGSLAHCPIIGETPLSNTNATPPAIAPTWPDGVVYAIEGGAEAGSAQAIAQGFVGPVGPVPVPEFTCGDGGTLPFPEAGPTQLLLPPPLPHATAAARADNYVYVADGALPLIHVIDVTNPLAPKELAPLFATSAAQPTRPVTVSGLAVSPFTRDYTRYLYAIDTWDNPPSIIVYDITDPVHSPHVPLQRPHSVLTPQLPVDRIQFSVPVAAVAFASHDFPLTQDPSSGANIVGAAGSGLLCNPNPNVDLGEVIDAATGFVLDSSFKDPGAFYRNNFEVQDLELGPTRLRGIFGFATLTNGEVALIDVDDWDSPCRRPVAMCPLNSVTCPGGPVSGFTSDIAPPEQQTPARGKFSGFTNPLDPYQVPEAGFTNSVPWVTGETFFPASQPHRPRGMYPFDDDPLLGIHYPQVQVQPQLFDIASGAGLTAGADAGDPNILPTFSTLADPSGYEGGTGVRLAWEDPLVHQNQNWTVTYEGVLPTFTGIEVNIQPNPADKTPFETLIISIPDGLFCRRGVEDQAIGLQRVAAAENAAAEVGLPSTAFPPKMNEWIGDYVQIADNLYPQSSPYWSSPNPGCWEGDSDAGMAIGPNSTLPQTARYEECFNYFQSLMPTQDIMAPYVTRDFPILEAYDDHLVVSRFSYPGDNPPPGMADAAASYPVEPATTNRSIVGPNPSNAQYLRSAYCCFHGQSTINVRAGGEWVASGSVSGLLHHITTDPATNRCVLSCDPQQALLNARNLGFFTTTNPLICAGSGEHCLDRNSALAMRNPMFAYFITHPVGPAPDLSPSNPMYPTNCTTVTTGSNPLCVTQRVTRDLSWEFNTINAFTNQFVNLAATGTQLDPQSMLFIPSLGQMAVVDGAQEGLVIIDLGTIAVSGSPYF